MDSIATRYAEGLLKLAVETDNVSSYKQFLSTVDSLFKEHPMLLRMLRSSFVSKKDKLSLLENVFPDSQWDHIRFFISLLIDNHRLGLFFKIRKEFDQLANQQLGIKEGIVYSVSLLTKKQIEAIEKQISSILNKQVILSNEVDKNILGGIKIFVDGRIYDYSINMKLESLKHKLLKRGA
jgi:F-type H+-transporting ATPase subunit delta